MTNYNDGNWHGWNGGECPVHPETEVEYITGVSGPARKESHYGAVSAARLSWLPDDDGWAVIAFRVIKEHREPREWWAVGMHLHNSEADAKAFRVRCDAMSPGGDHLNTPIVRVREVIE